MMSIRTLSSRPVSKKQPVVIDLGSAFIRCGFAGEPRPIHVIPSPIGVNADAEDNESSSSSNSKGRDHAISLEQARAARTREEWVEALTGVLARLYTESLQCRPRERKVVICESMVTPRPLREAVAHVLFRFLQVPALHMCAGPAPALLCTGLDTGLVLDVGRVEAHVMAVYRGANITASFTGAPLGCRAVQERLGELLVDEEQATGAVGAGGAREAEGVGAGAGKQRPLSTRELEDVMVRACLVPVGGVPSANQVSPMEFMFSGRRRVTASGAVRTAAVEQALFEGDGEGRSLATLVLDCLKRCPRDCRRALAQNVVVAGGGALLPGLCARLAEEIKALADGPALAPTAAAAALSPRDSAISTLGNPGGYAWARAAVFGDRRCEVAGAAGAAEGAFVAAGGGDNDTGEGGGGEGGLCVVKVPVRRDQLVWTGASIMASLGSVVAERSLTIERYLRGGGGGGEELSQRGVSSAGGRLPDWMSVSAEDWLFEGATAAAAAVDAV